MKIRTFDSLVLGRGFIMIAAVLAVLLFGMLPAPAQAPPAQSCKALSEIANDLYLVDANGNMIFQFTQDGADKLSASLAPDGKKVVFVPTASPLTFTIADMKGQPRSFNVPKVNYDLATFVGPSWNGDRILRLDWHAGKEADLFKFFSVSRGLSSPLRHASGQDFGVICSAMREDDEDQRVACLQDGDLLINGKIVFSASPFSSATQLDSLVLTVGSPAATHGDLSFQVVVTSLVAGVTLKVTLPNGNFQQSRIASGDFMSLVFNDQVYEFAPTVLNASKGLVNLQVLNANSSAVGFDPVLAWQDETIVLVKRSNDGASLIVLRRKGSDDNQWVEMGQASLNISDPIIDLHFTDDSTLLFATSQEFGEFKLDLKKSGSDDKPQSVQVGPIIQLPRSLTVKLASGPATAQVVGWSCHSSE